MIKLPKLFGSSSKKTTVYAKLLMYIAWRNLVSKKLRTFLTVFGIIIGIGAIFFLLSFGLGLQHLVTEEVIGNQSIKSIDIASPNSKILRLDQETVAKINNLPHVQKIGSSFSFPGSIKYNGSEIDSIAYGVDENFMTLSNLTVVEGRLFKNEDTKAVFVNTSVLSSIGVKDKKDVIGKKLNVRIPLQGASKTNTEIVNEYTVIGVIDSGAGSEIFVPNFIFENAGVLNFSQVKLVADDTSKVGDLRKQIESMGFETTSPIDTIDQINQIFKFFNVILVSFGAIGMIVAVLGMFNTLTISLLERTKEIGLMIALGGRRRDMKRLFIYEAVLLSVVGALIGIGLAMILGSIINVVMNQFAQNRGVTNAFDLFATPFWLIAAIVGFMVCVGLAVVFFPARRAQKINPIDALRRE